VSARDELASVIVEAYGENPDMCPCEQDMDVADAVLAAGYRKPRTITTREEVEALPDGSVLLDSAGDVAHLRDGFWFSYETSPMTHHRMAKYTPATVLHEPEADR